ncbi:hypothetical protein [Campylobacter hyointestinalis]|uniref:hypothetical protein n=1 Tax=Campylobacter hyointestinalis TaxID=198 RepID=UPI000DCCBA62|nr:hypothetical protein [Campylobacter hyointestinalis]RAZ58736.1 hypothetical protein CHL10071_09635 [Campylobacter hyointestinalis subsp. lawsonii]
MTIKETKEMIAVLEAYINGEKIEFSRVYDDDWHHISIPSWNWDRYKYRIKHKEENIKAKFKQGDEIVHKELCNGVPLNEDNDFLIIEDINLSENKYKVYNKGIGAFEFFDIEWIDENYVNTDDCLWYWEYRDILRDIFYISNNRLNKAAYKRVFTNSDWELSSEPIYQLGARLPKECE